MPSVSLLRTQNLPLLWFERLRVALHLPFWSAGVVIFTLPFVALDALTSYFVGAWQYYTAVEVSQYPAFMIFLLVCYYGAAYARKRIENLQAYCVALGVETDSQLNLTSLTRMKGVSVFWAVQFFTLVPLFTFASTAKLSLVQLALVNVIPYIYAFLIISTFFWVYGYSMYAVYKMGKLPLILKPFTEDKILGLRPFGATSLRLTMIFFTLIVLFAVLALLQINVGLTSSAALLFGLGFPLVTGLFGLTLFFLPLGSLRRKLIQKKREELGWLEPRRTKIIEQLRNIKDGTFDMGLLNEYNSITEIEKGIHQVHNWPYDLGILARLVAIILSVTAIVLSRLIALALHF